MIDRSKNISDWLNQEPVETEVENKNGGCYIPIEFIKTKLDVLDPSWGRKNFHHFIYQDHDGNWICSGSAELDIEYAIPQLTNTITGIIEQWRTIKRTLCGGATFYVEDYKREGNTHYAAICLSLCIVSAAQDIAPFFGKNLNKVAPENKISNTINNLLK